MNIRNLNIKDASSDALRALAQDIDVELQECDLAAQAAYEDAMTRGICISELAEADRKGYHDYLKDNMKQHPAAANLIEEYYSEEQYKSAIRNEGA